LQSSGEGRQEACFIFQIRFWTVLIFKNTDLVHKCESGLFFSSHFFYLNSHIPTPFQNSASHPGLAPCLWNNFANIFSFPICKREHPACVFLWMNYFEKCIFVRADILVVLIGTTQVSRGNWAHNTFTKKNHKAGLSYIGTVLYTTSCRVSHLRRRPSGACQYIDNPAFIFLGSLPNRPIPPEPELYYI